MPDAQKLIRGALRNCIQAHGAITEQWVDSAAKRIEGQLAGVDYESYWRRRYTQLRDANLQGRNMSHDTIIVLDDERTFWFGKHYRTVPDAQSAIAEAIASGSGHVDYLVRIRGSG